MDCNMQSAFKGVSKGPCFFGASSAYNLCAIKPPELPVHLPGSFPLALHY